MGIMSFLNDKKWVLDESGIFLSKEEMAGTAFSDEQQDGLWQLEDESWWFQYRADVIVGLMDAFFDRNKMAIDVGGGNGYTSSIAAKRGYRTGLIEPSPEACRHAKMRGMDEVCCGTVADDTVNDDVMEQVLLLDVLEHIEDDRSFLDLLHKKIKMGGYCIITVPAFMCLWSSEDDAAGHFRRYRMSQLCQLADACGFEVCYRSYFMSFLFLPILLVRVSLEKIGFLKKAEDRSDEEREEIMKSQFKSQSKLVRWVLGFVEKWERRMMKKPDRVPFGSSIVVVVRKGLL